jgi:hypothetical protein
VDENPPGCLLIHRPGFPGSEHRTRLSIHHPGLCTCAEHTAGRCIRRSS